MIQADRLGIILFMETEVLNCLILISTFEGRLLDELNGRSQAGPDNKDKFLIGTDATIWHTDETSETAAVVHINKENIEMAGTVTPDAGRGIGAKDGPKPYPFTEKIPVKVTIELPGYRLNGNMYRLNHQQVDHVLKEKTLFVPLTDVEVISLDYDKQWFLSFVAVNKDKILSVHEHNIVS